MRRWGPSVLVFCIHVLTAYFAHVRQRDHPLLSVSSDMRVRVKEKQRRHTLRLSKEWMIYFQGSVSMEMADASRSILKCSSSFGLLLLPFAEYVRFVPTASLVVVRAASLVVLERSLKLTFVACEHGNTVGITIPPCSTAETRR